MSDRSLELDKGMCTVVAVRRNSLAISAVVGIIADCTLVADSSDVARVVLAERTIAKDTEVDFATS